MPNDPLDRFKDQVFYREALRLRAEQQSRMPTSNLPSNVVSFEQWRREHPVQRLPDKPIKPAA